jgi:hypothetical protein
VVWCWPGLGTLALPAAVTKKHSKGKTPVKTVSRALKRTPGALRQKAYALGISLGHRNKRK